MAGLALLVEGFLGVRPGIGPLSPPGVDEVAQAVPARIFDGLARDVVVQPGPNGQAPDNLLVERPVPLAHRRRVREVELHGHHVGGTGQVVWRVHARQAPHGAVGVMHGLGQRVLLGVAHVPVVVEADLVGARDAIIFALGPVRDLGGGGGRDDRPQERSHLVFGEHIAFIVFHRHVVVRKHSFNHSISGNKDLRRPTNMVFMAGKRDTTEAEFEGVRDVLRTALR